MHHDWDIEEEEEFQKSLDKKIMLRLIGYFRPYKWVLVLIITLAVLVAGSNLLNPVLAQRAIDNCIKKANAHRLFIIVGIFLANNILGWWLMYGRMRSMFWVGQRLIYDLRDELFKHLQKLSLSYYDRTKQGRIIARVTSDLNVLEEIMSFGVGLMVRIVLTIIGALVLMLIYSWQLFLVTFFIVPLLIFANWIFERKAAEAYRSTRETISKVTSNLAENIAGIRVVQSFTRESINLERFKELNQRNREANVRAAKIFSLYMPSIDLIGAVGVAIIVLMGGILVTYGKTTVGIIVGFLGLFDLFFFPIHMMTELYNASLAAMAAAERVFAVLDTTPDVSDAADAEEMPRIEGNVKFDDVTFSYNGSGDVLHNINLEAKPGEVVALVGPTGAGKTTIVNLIARFYQPQHGKITIDGRDLRHVTLESLRRQMGIVLQDGFLFSGTVMDNIKYGRLEATDEEVVAAAKALGSHEIIENFENGYQTEVGERGLSLSCGQRQLVNFTRAMVANPRILILDEATSSVDAHTEFVVQECLQRLVSNRTSFVIAHRLSTVRHADKVLVINDGRIVESGNHNTLLSKNGIYAKMYDEFVREF